MKISLPLLALTLAAMPLVAQAASPAKTASNAPRAATLRNLQTALKSSLSRAAESKVALPNLEANASNPVRPATKPAFLAASRLTSAEEATTLPKDFEKRGSNFLRGAKTTKSSLQNAPKGTKSNAVRARSASLIRSSLQVSSLRKLPMNKTP